MQTYSEDQRTKKRRKRFFLLFVVVVALALAAAFVLMPKARQADKPTTPTTTKQSSPSENTQQKTRVYDSGKYVFGMPENWKQLEASEIKSYKVSGGIRSDDGKAALATMTILSKTLNADELLGELEKTHKQLPGYQKISSGEVKIGENQGVQFTYTYVNNGTISQQTIHAASVKGETYYLAFFAAKDDYDSYKDVWAKILASYRIK